MATKNHARATFTAKLLAPLPVDAEPVDTESFRASLRADEKATARTLREGRLLVWNRAKYALNVAKGEHKAAFYRYLLADRSLSTQLTERKTAERVKDAERAMLLLPAPGQTELSWKLANLRHQATDPIVAAAVAADTARIAPKQEA